MEDLTKAIEIVPRIWWVGVALPSDEFQAHAYLVEQGDQSVLIDPGGALTIEATRAKIESIIPFGDIRYFICHHQDPDIVGGLPLVDQWVERDDALLVTHWRAAVLLAHLGLKRLPLWNIDAHDWHLLAGARELQFVFTPYLHFPGAFATFDPESKTLFSSDLFGGFVDAPSFRASGEGVLAGIRAFHEHYMPSREILRHTLTRIQKLKPERIAPQHGTLLEGEMVERVLGELMGLDCGLHLLSHQDGDLRRLLDLSGTLKSALRVLHLETELRQVAAQLLELFKQAMPVQSLDFLAQQEEQLLSFSSQNRYRGVNLARIPSGLAKVSVHGAGRGLEDFCFILEAVDSPSGLPQLVVQLGQAEGEQGWAVALLGLSSNAPPDQEMKEVLHTLRVPMAAAVERELLLRRIREQRDAFHEQAIRDPLTNLYTRRHMNDVVPRMCALHDRESSAGFAVLMVDADHFKAVNDTYGHSAGDAVLRGISEVVQRSVRSADMPVRFGGEEFVILANLPGPVEATILGERIRRNVQSLSFADVGGPEGITVSLGFALREQGEAFASVLERADTALYQAKQSGRNRVIGREREA